MTIFKIIYKLSPYGRIVMNMKKIILLLALIMFSVNLVFSQQLVNPFAGGADSSGSSNKAMDRADDATDKMEGLIPMRFFNAMDRKPIPNASVEIPNAGTFITNNSGKIVFPKIPDGNYTLIFTKEGFITTPIDFRVILGAVDFNWYSISPGFSNRDLRIVLEWSEKPADLDLHFVKSGGSGGYHISYGNMRSAEDGNTTLDRDDRAGYGPETITIGKIEANANYTCYINDYTNRSNARSTQMAQQGAIIRIYSLNKLMHTFRIPANGTGPKWNVFKIERGNIVPVNTVTAN